MTPEIYTPTLPPVNVREVIRYAGGCDGSAVSVAEECIREAEGAVSCRAVSVCVPVTLSEGIVECDVFSAATKDLSYTLRGCRRALIFGATVGVEIDRLIRKYGATSPVKALFMQAIGAERIEALCDVLCDILTEKYGALTPRFSPGYGDFSIEVQRDIISCLDCPRAIGLTLNESLLMSPTKSVTAVAGIICEK